MGQMGYNDYTEIFKGRYNMISKEAKVTILSPNYLEIKIKTYFFFIKIYESVEVVRD